MARKFTVTEGILRVLLEDDGGARALRPDEKAPPDVSVFLVRPLTLDYVMGDLVDENEKKGGARTALDSIDRWLVGWEGVVDGGGIPLAFSVELFRSGRIEGAAELVDTIFAFLIRRATPRAAEGKASTPSADTLATTPSSGTTTRGHETASPATS